ncbi:MAG TPA: lipopolysaccharide assembly protein LapB [Casimicrobium huifangae]|nr:lipopolysaccharide assembly protein LapB [Casimicrobium huifangae]HQA33990.1 lipopolysaccharide assembly protein LapB [Casimicrobium huifangae]HQD64664.1 lipopolysaccharide assembly protein LapB [Casimicrobium huifangae]
MDFEAWWLLVPLGCFALGWFAARVDIRYVLRDARALPSAYFRGLNFLLREQHDRAVESFVDVSRRDPHALDLQLALGSLFRRQGRIGEATGIHQGLVDRHDLPKEKRELALFELAQDFHAAGLFDRAESVYEQLTGTSFEAEAVTRLASVLEQEKAWQRAIAARERIQRISGEPQGRFIAQYHCELAEVALAEGKDEQIAQHLAAASENNRNNARVPLIAFRSAIKRGNNEAAKTALAEILRTRADLSVLVADDVVNLYQSLGSPGTGVEQLALAQQAAPTSLGLSRLVDASLKIEGRDAAIARLKRELTAQPSARQASRLLELESSRYDGEAAETMKGIAQLLLRATDRTPGFHCTHCGFRAPRYYWKCPGCNEWESFCATPLGQ